MSYQLIGCRPCGYDWNLPIDEVRRLIAAAPDRLAALVSGRDALTPTVLPWSASSYVWHLADVLRISAERLWALRHGPHTSVTSYDPDELAAARHYPDLPVAGGLWALRRSVADREIAVGESHAADAYQHPEFGRMTVTEVIRAMGHEVHHHTWDVERSLGPA